MFAPFLLFTVLSQADLHTLFSGLLVVSLIAAATTALVFAVVARLFWHRSASETLIGSLAASYVNGNNIGIPVGVYILGNGAYSAPIVLLQLMVFAPLALTILDVQARGKVSLWRVVVQPFTNPIIVGSTLGVLLAVLHVKLPDAAIEPFRLIAGASVPAMLLAFGMSLHGQRPLAAGSPRRDVLFAAALKIGFMPLVAWIVGDFLFHLRGQQLFAVVTLAALPTAQNVFNYAQRYQQGVIMSRDVVAVATLTCVPVLVLIAALLSP